MKNFHSGSYDKTIVPILISTLAPEINTEILFAEDGTSNCIKANETTLKQVLTDLDTNYKKENFNVDNRENFSYKTTPIIVEAAQVL